MKIFLLLFTCVDDVTFTHIGLRQQSFSICMSRQTFKLVMEFDLKLLYYMSFFKVTSVIFFHSSFCQIKSNSILHQAILWSEISEEFKIPEYLIYFLYASALLSNQFGTLQRIHIQKLPNSQIFALTRALKEL